MITIKTYKELNQYVKAFKEKNINLLVINSRGGLGKTYITEEELIEDAPLIFTGHVTPLSLYTEVYERNTIEEKFITVFDDIDTLMMNKSNVSILKQLCDTKEIKTIQYFSSILKDIPSEFQTQTKVLMLVNSLDTDDKNLKALLTRAHIVNFNPADIEILNNLKTFATDAQIIKFIEHFAPFSKTLNLRVYKRAEELKKSKLPWQKEIIESLNIDEKFLEMYELLSKYKTDKERESKFNGSRTTYYRIKKMFMNKNPQYAKKMSNL